MNEYREDELSERNFAKALDLPECYKMAVCKIDREDNLIQFKWIDFVEHVKRRSICRLNPSVFGN